MSASDVFEDGLLSLILTNVAYANVGDAGGLRGSLADGVFWIAIHTSGVGDTSTQSTSEATYTGYTAGGARQSVVRTVSGWTVTAGIGDNDAVISFGLCTGGSNTIHSFTLGSASSGAGNMFLWGDLGSDTIVSNNVTPTFGAGQLDITLG